MYWDFFNFSDRNSKKDRGFPSEKQLNSATIIKRDFVFYAECKDVRCKSILRIGCILDGALPLSCLEWSTFIRAVGSWIT